MIEPSLEVTVALVAPATEFAPQFEKLNRVEGARHFIGTQASPDLGKPYDELKKITLDVRPEELVSIVLGRAADVLAPDVTGERKPVGLRLYEAVLDRGFPVEEVSSTWERIPFVDAETRLWWRTSSALDLPYSWLINAADVGVIRGDPLRPYLMLAGRGGIRGGLDPVSWRELHYLWVAIKPWLEDASAIGGSAWILAAARRLAVGLFISDRHGHGWGERGAIPPDLFRLLDGFDEVDTAHQVVLLHALLGCSADEARVLLRLRRTRGTPRNGDERADLLAAFIAESLLNYYRDPDPQRWVSRVLSGAETDFADLIPSQPPDPPDDFEWAWPAS